jgi:Fic family protein
VYIHELSDWPRFHWDQEGLANQLAAVRHRQGRLIGRMEGLGFRLREEAVLDTLTQDVLKSSEIEGEVLDRDQVWSSIARRLGIDIGALAPADRDVEGVVEMMLEATQQYDEPLTEERLFAWHASLFPTGRSGMHRIKTGGWRDDSTGPMQVVSGPISKEQVHFRAPEAKRLAREMKAFLKWFNRPPETDPVLKSALAHLWFVTIHPFDDGNGRLGRPFQGPSRYKEESSFTN